MRALRSEDKGQARACPDRARAIPARCGRGARPLSKTSSHRMDVESIKNPAMQLGEDWMTWRQRDQK